MFVDLLFYWFVGLLVCSFLGSLIYWSVSLLFLWFVGLLVC